MMPSITASYASSSRRSTRLEAARPPLDGPNIRHRFSWSEPNASPATPAPVDKFDGRRRSAPKSAASRRELAPGLLVQERIDVLVGKLGRDRNGARHTIARLAPETGGIGDIADFQFIGKPFVPERILTAAELALNPRRERAF